MHLTTIRTAAVLSLWLAASARERMETEADRTYPLETGGILVGYPTAQGPVVIDVIGPGPNASFRRRRFVPDAAYQERQLAALYEASGRLHTYLGDWHTHPDGIAAPSWLDRRTLHRIARSPSARAPEPIMIILTGRPGCWKLGGFQLLHQKRSWWRQRKLERLDERIYH